MYFKYGAKDFKISELALALGEDKKASSAEDNNSYAKFVRGRWFMEPVVRDGYTVKGTWNFLDGGEFIFHGKVGSQVGTQDVIFKGEFEVKNNTICTDINDVHPTEFKECKSIQQMFKKYQDPIYSASKFEIILKEEKTSKDYRLTKI